MSTLPSVRCRDRPLLRVVLDLREDEARDAEDWRLGTKEPNGVRSRGGNWGKQGKVP